MLPLQKDVTLHHSGYRSRSHVRLRQRTQCKTDELNKVERLYLQ